MPNVRPPFAFQNRPCVGRYGRCHWQPCRPALADGDALTGGIIGGAIAAEGNKKRKTTTRSTRSKPASSGISSATRAANRDVQTALNTFGFPVGTPDGSLGPKSRTAISQYQVFMGYPATGQLTEVERAILVGAWQKSMIGGMAVSTVVASHPQGIRGLLANERDMMANGMAVGGGTMMVGGSALAGLPTEISAVVYEIAQNSGLQAQQLVQKAGFIQLADMNADGRTDYLLDTSATGSDFWCGPDSCAVRVFVSTPEGFRRNDFQAFEATPAMFSCSGGACIKSDDAPTMVAQAPAPQPLIPTPAPGAGTMVAATPTPAPALPVFTVAQPATPVLSAAAHCANVAMVSSSAGGFVTEASLTDTLQAVGEQFCLARGYAMNDGQELAAKVVGATPQQIEAQCQGLVPAMAAQVAVLAQAPVSDAVLGAQGFVASSGQPAAALADMGRICLSVAYRTDNAEMALGSALILTGAGSVPYGELLGHHLTLGLGLPADPARGAGWYQLALAAMAKGAPAVFAPAQPERNGLLTKVAQTLVAAPVTLAVDPSAQPQPAAVLPSFALAPTVPTQP